MIICQCMQTQAIIFPYSTPRIMLAHRVKFYNQTASTRGMDQTTFLLATISGNLNDARPFPSCYVIHEAFEECGPSYTFIKEGKWLKHTHDSS